MKVYVTAISAVRIGEDGKLEHEVRPAIVKSPSNDTKELNNNLLAEAALKWPWSVGWRCHKAAKFREISRAQTLKMLDDLEADDL